MHTKEVDAWQSTIIPKRSPSIFYSLYILPFNFPRIRFVLPTTSVPSPYHQRIVQYFLNWTVASIWWIMYRPRPTAFCNICLFSSMTSMPKPVSRQQFEWLRSSSFHLRWTYSIPCILDKGSLVQQWLLWEILEHKRKEKFVACCNSEKQPGARGDMG